MAIKASWAACASIGGFFSIRSFLEYSYKLGAHALEKSFQRAESSVRSTRRSALERRKVTPPVSAIIETKGLNKIYEATFKGQDVHALKDLNLQIHSGEIFGYLGPNGSGKTTTIKMLLGLIFPSSGEITILGHTDIASSKVKRNIGYLPEGGLLS